MRDQILMGRPGQRWQRCSDCVEDVLEEEEWCNAGYIDEPKKESYLPDSVHGSPHHMVALAKNALMLVSEYGCPHAFMTLTCNPQWPEILSQIINWQSAHDCPDVTVPIFKPRLDLLCSLSGISIIHNRSRIMYKTPFVLYIMDRKTRQICPLFLFSPFFKIIWLGLSIIKNRIIYNTEKFSIIHIWFLSPF
jgi:hypothetical protein